MLDFVIIGAAQAGLSMSYHMTKSEIKYLVVDGGSEVGGSWLSRWDSLKLFTPTEYNHLPGLKFDSPKGYYPNKFEVAAYFKKYVETVVPENPPSKYSELSYNFFTKNLNRMTQNDLTKYINDVGFELVNFMSVPDLNLLNVIDDSTLDSAKTIHPTITLNDLLCSSVFFIGRK